MWKALLSRLDAQLSRLSFGGVVLAASFGAAVIGLLDFWIGYEASTSFLYLMPIFIAGWYGNRTLGYLFTFFSIFLWTWINWLTGQTYSNELIRVWNAVIRIITFSLFVSLLNELKLALDTERALARTDGLTGIFNKREFEKRLKLELKRAARYSYPVCLIFIDLDNFKQVNDTLGHSEGDAQLKRIAGVISGVIRQTDLFARLGGDEFGLFLPNVNRTAVKTIVSKIERAVAAEMETVQSPITLSVGAVTFRTPPASADDMIRKADALMYQAKFTGKGRSLYFEED